MPSIRQYTIIIFHLSDVIAPTPVLQLLLRKKKKEKEGKNSEDEKKGLKNEMREKLQCKVNFFNNFISLFS